MVRSLGFGFVLVSMVGCSGGHSDNAQVPAPQQPAKTPAETIQKMWRDHLRPKSNTATLHEVVTSGDVLAQLLTFKECFERVNTTLGAEERKTCIEHGSMQDLDREGRCWEVDTARDSVRGSHVGYIDMDGKLVFVWWCPEG